MKGNLAGNFLVGQFFPAWKRFQPLFLARLAQQIGQGETSLQAAASIATVYGSDVFSLLGCKKDICNVFFSCWTSFAFPISAGRKTSTNDGRVYRALQRSGLALKVTSVLVFYF